MFVRSTLQALYGTARNGCGAVQAESPPLPPQRRPAGAEFGTSLQALYTRTNYILRTTSPTTGHGSPCRTWKWRIIVLCSQRLGETLCDRDRFDNKVTV
jgi:hypothetical protein